jgi:hypothetical protein
MNTQNTFKFDPNVFALTAIEKQFESDDTAWQFLRWNPDYREAFHQLRDEKSDADALEAILAHIKDPNPAPRIRRARRGSVLLHGSIPMKNDCRR